MYLLHAQSGTDMPSANRSAITLDRIGAVAERLLWTNDNGARLRCASQNMQGDVTREGLWLRSTVKKAAVSPAERKAVGVMNDRFRVTATAMRRATNVTLFERTGIVAIAERTVRFVRPGLTEEYSVSMLGVRQDFVVHEKPCPLMPQESEAGGMLRLELKVNGAEVKQAPQGVQLVLENSRREIAYSRLRVVDSEGKELPARMEVFESVTANSLSLLIQGPQLPPTAALESGVGKLAVLVNDSDAVYPIRIDPTFSDANWVSLNPNVPGANGAVHAVVVDGVGNLYIGGSFRIVGDVFANGIAKWNGSGWGPLGSGISGIVYALAVSGSDVYAAGIFTTAGGSPAHRVAKWNGSTWSSLGSGLGGGSGTPSVHALAVAGGDLYVGGHFTMATNSGGLAVSVNNIARWNGSTWSALGSGQNAEVRALTVLGSDVYAGGEVTQTGASVAKWNGSSWSALGSGMNGSVDALAVSGTAVYAGGGFTMAGGIAATNIAKWNGSSWSAVGSGMDAYVDALAVSGSRVYAAGDFTTAGGIAAKRIAEWNGSVWTALGSGMNTWVYALAVAGSNVYAAGTFNVETRSPATGVARWDGSSWSAFGTGMNASVRSLAITKGDLYAGGYFTVAGGITANYVVKWNGSNWDPLALGMNGGVRALAVADSTLYAGGWFTAAGGSEANRVAKWDGSSWSALGSGTDGSVYALSASGDTLYAGGSFTMAGGNVATNIAKWNGSTWSALGQGLNGTVYALAISGSNLYAGGFFTSADRRPANRVARWNGSSWNALGSGLGGVLTTVYTLAVSGEDLYVGGRFTTAGGLAATNIAKWNGTNWSPLGLGFGGPSAIVLALAVSGGDVYGGGYNVTTAGGIPAMNIAKWNGSSWGPLGSGMDHEVYALAVAGSDIFAGGNFSAAGNKVSAYMARAYLEQPALSAIRSGSDVTISWPTFYGSFILQQNPQAANSNSWATANFHFHTNGAMKSATVPITSTNQFFRLIGN